MTRNIGKHRYRVSIQEPVYTPNTIGASDITYNEIRKVRARIRFTRSGGGGTKKLDTVNEINMERIDFTLTPQDIDYDWTMVYKGVRYEIAAIDRLYDQTKVSCYASPMSNADNESNG